MRSFLHVEAEALSNALTTADGVILPLHCEYFALEGMQQLLNTIKLVRDRLNPKVFLFGVVLTMYVRRAPRPAVSEWRLL